MQNITVVCCVTMENWYNDVESSAEGDLWREGSGTFELLPNLPETPLYSPEVDGWVTFWITMFVMLGLLIILGICSYLWTKHRVPCRCIRYWVYSPTPRSGPEFEMYELKQRNPYAI